MPILVPTVSFVKPFAHIEFEIYYVVQNNIQYPTINSNYTYVYTCVVVNDITIAAQLELKVIACYSEYYSTTWRKVDELRCLVLFV
jgi:hypothetical protein